MKSLSDAPEVISSQVTTDQAHVDLDKLEQDRDLNWSPETNCCQVGSIDGCGVGVDELGVGEGGGGEIEAERQDAGDEDSADCWHRSGDGRARDWWAVSDLEGGHWP